MTLGLLDIEVDNRHRELHELEAFKQYLLRFARTLLPRIDDLESNAVFAGDALLAYVKAVIFRARVPAAILFLRAQLEGGQKLTIKIAGKLRARLARGYRLYANSADDLLVVEIKLLGNRETVISKSIGRAAYQQAIGVVVDRHGFGFGAFGQFKLTGIIQTCEVLILVIAGLGRLALAVCALVGVACCTLVGVACCSIAIGTGCRFCAVASLS